MTSTELFFLFSKQLGDELEIGFPKTEPERERTRIAKREIDLRLMDGQYPEELGKAFAILRICKVWIFQKFESGLLRNEKEEDFDRFACGGIEIPIPK